MGSSDQSVRQLQRFAHLRISIQIAGETGSTGRNDGKISWLVWTGLLPYWKI